MNTLGQLKTLLDIQALRGFTSHSSNAVQNTESSSFEELLKMSLTESDKIQETSSLMANSLGAVYSMANLTQTKTTPVLTELAGKVSLPITKEVSDQTKPIASNLEAIINKAAEKYQLPAKLIKSIIKHESNFNPSVVSHAGASGLMQLMPKTAQGLGVTNILDPEQNVMGGSKYLRSMLDKYDGNIQLALAAYNAGPGNVNKYGGIPPFKETQAYVKKVTNTFYS